MSESEASSLTGEPPQQHDWLSLIPILAGLYWLLAGGAGFGWLLCALVPGALLLASGLSVLMWPGEAKITYYMAFGGVLGVLLSIPAAFAEGLLPALGGVLVSVAGFFASGRIALKYAPRAEGAPRPPAEARVFAKVALDEALIGYFVGVAKIPSGQRAADMCTEARALESALSAGGWLDDPASFHATPAAPEDARLESASWGGFALQRLRFSSGFAAHPTLPGAEVWAGHARNRECHVRVFRHATRKPWLVGVHGYRMGWDWLDLRLFLPGWLHAKLGYNLALPVLPLHGTRRLGRQSGDHYLDGDLLDLLHAQSQALWDLRRTIAWIRAQDPGAPIGVLGYSLGGYNAALLAAHEPGLEFAIAGIPVADFASTLWNLVPPPHRTYFAAQGLDLARYQRLLKVVSPLACAPRLPPERLHLFAGSADRIVPPEQPLLLARHWQRPVNWYPGGHLTFRNEPAVKLCIESALASVVV